jgi:hypothetical protein
MTGKDVRFSFTDRGRRSQPCIASPKRKNFPKERPPSIYHNLACSMTATIEPHLSRSPWQRRDHGAATDSPAAIGPFELGASCENVPTTTSNCNIGTTLEYDRNAEREFDDDARCSSSSGWYRCIPSIITLTSENAAAQDPETGDLWKIFS